MDFKTLIVFILPHIPVENIGEIIFRYSSPISLNTFDIRFCSLPGGLPTLTCYFRISSLRKQVSAPLCENKEETPTAGILERIFDTICRSQHMNYGLRKHRWSLYGEIFALEATIDDPSIIMAYDERLDYGRDCIYCNKYAMSSSHTCADCFDLDGEDPIDMDFRTQCERERMEVENQEVDKEFSGLICTFDEEEYDFTLTCIWSGFKIDEEDESPEYHDKGELQEYLEYRADRGTMSLSRWESEEVRSQGYTYTMIIYPY